MKVAARTMRKLERWIPSVLLQAARRLVGAGTRFSGPYSSWADACVNSAGYQRAAVLERVLDASRKVRDGMAVYERDSVLFDRVEFSFPLLSTLLRSALERGGALSVVDFGGALGSSYRECKPFLGDAVRPLRWAVIEQPTFVAVGRREMQTSELLFFESLSSAARDHPVDVALLSGVLQYLERPMALLGEVTSLKPRYVVLDRTITIDGNCDLLYVQHVPSSIYQASYPVWMLSYHRLVATLSGAYELISEHESLRFPELEGYGAGFKGFIWRAKGCI